jgi:hypothetical protein
MPMGAGKTVTFAEVIRRARPARAMVLAHREELVFQARDKIQSLTGLDVGVEMGELRAWGGGLLGCPRWSSRGGRAVRLHGDEHLGEGGAGHAAKAGGFVGALIIGGVEALKQASGK